jgi:hypothetical protein
MSIKSSSWNIEVLERRLYKNVCFDHPVTAEEAADAMYDETYEDILDEERLEIVSIPMHAVEANEDEDDEETEYEEDISWLEED